VPDRRRAILAALFTGLTTLFCGALLAAAVLVPAPEAVLPFVIVACLGCPMAASYDLARAIGPLRDARLQLRRDLDRLPETPHPLDL
jgi:hypothetical protein